MDDLQLLQEYVGEGSQEAFAELVIDRPCPVADRVSPVSPQLWSSAHARFERTGDMRIAR